ncbi:MAG TPA: zinc ribbon domain-containing protein [Anaerolineaceae bacterium]|mgnify:CR=1 FL=1|jgi:hypothetical protein|nr:zinc ribbon domain-containing protein [Anaerolineaceae bacterium]
MDVGSFFLIIAITLLAGIWIIRPFFQSQASKALVEETACPPEIRRRNLVGVQERILAAIQELDADSDLGKIARDEYVAQRSRLVLSGAVVLEQLEAIPDTPEQTGASLFSAEEDAALATRLAARRAVRQEMAAGFCPQCGRPVQQSDRFCAHCGRTL